MSDRDIGTVILLCVFFMIAALAVGVSFGVDYGTEQTRQEAVDTGNAHWVVDDHGKVEFFWNVQAESEAAQ